MFSTTAGACYRSVWGGPPPRKIQWIEWIQWIHWIHWIHSTQSRELPGPGPEAKKWKSEKTLAAVLAIGGPGWAGAGLGLLLAAGGLGRAQKLKKWKSEKPLAAALAIGGPGPGWGRSWPQAAWAGPRS